MKSKKTNMFRTLLICGGSSIVLASSAFAASATWNNPAVNTNLNNGANWSSGNATFADNDTVTWDGTQTGDLSLQWTAGLGPGSGANGGLNLSIATNSTSLQLDGVTGQNLGIGNITIAAGAGAFTLGDGVGTATVVYRAPVAATAFTNNSSNTATIKSDVSFLNGGGVGNRVITFTGTGNWLAEGTVISATNFGAAATSASLVKSGTGTLTLAGANGYGGSTTLNDGVLAVTNGSALGSGGAMAINGSFGARLEVSNNIALAGPTTISLTGRSNTADSTSAGASIRNVSGNNSISSNIAFANVGGTNVNILSSAGTLTLGGTISATLSTATGRTFNFTGAGNIVSNGNITDGTIAVGVFKNGSGTLTLGGSNNNYTGATTVSDGKLLVNGNVSTSIVNVTTGATIGGSGTVGGNLTVSSGATLAPGNSAGNLTLGNGLTLAGAYSWELAALSTASPGTNFDTTTVTAGSVDITGAVLQLSLGAFAPSAASFWQADQTWSGIINNTGAGSLTGSFAAIDNSAWSSLGAFSTTTTGNDVNLVWTSAAAAVVPEPTSGAALGLAGMLLALRRRRAAGN